MSAWLQCVLVSVCCITINQKPSQGLTKNKHLLLSHRSACLPGHLCFRSVPWVSEAQNGMAELSGTCSSHSKKSKVPTRARRNKLCFLRPRLGTGTLNFLPSTFHWSRRLKAMSNVQSAGKCPPLTGVWARRKQLLNIIIFTTPGTRHVRLMVALLIKGRVMNWAISESNHPGWPSKDQP